MGEFDHEKAPETTRFSGNPAMLGKCAAVVCFSREMPYSALPCRSANGVHAGNKPWKQGIKTDMQHYFIYIITLYKII